ncbi:hypothetical protein FRX31_031516 [Thalictrum thalictroides]|uniref:Uncharacterized protein n=1 Tax=Thalictrum thalictroides TaxID=46969 RepID=A0A7J6V1N2_THATH|nr:hypothetical protein FRX31_031516 [Thalictrum thalictroides]
MWSIFRPILSINLVPAAILAAASAPAIFEHDHLNATNGFASPSLGIKIPIQLFQDIKYLVISMGLDL